MQNHHHSTLDGHPRAEKRQDYAHIYVCVRTDAADALRDKRDSHLLAWTNYAQAATFAGRCGMIVVNWEGFLTRYLPRLPERPEAARIIVDSKRGRHKYHAELDASPEELRTLNTYCEWELRRSPETLGGKLKRAKVWQEEEGDDQ